MLMVHPVYMARGKPLRWRVTKIRQWRKFRNFTLESAADALARAPYNIETTHTSLQRLENGLQMPKIELIEALAGLYKTDTHSLLNRSPGMPLSESGAGAQEMAALWDEAAPEDRDIILKVAGKFRRLP